MKILELFAGSRSFSQSAELAGHTTFTTDIEPFESIDYVTDVLDFDPERVPFTPDIIWASPPCTAFSVASIGTHWGGGHRAYEPKTENAKLGIRLVEKTLEIIKHYQSKNPDLLYYIENPRGVLRKLPVMGGVPLRHTVTYCQYGDKRMKPTDIWTNDFKWQPRPMCKNGAPCHVPAPRGAKTGTQGLAGSFERSKIPLSVGSEILGAHA